MGRAELWSSNVGNYRAGIRDPRCAHIEKLSIKCKQIKPPDGPAKLIPVIFHCSAETLPGLSDPFPAPHGGGMVGLEAAMWCHPEIAANWGAGCQDAGVHLQLQASCKKLEQRH